MLSQLSYRNANNNFAPRIASQIHMLAYPPLIPPRALRPRISWVAVPVLMPPQLPVLLLWPLSNEQ